MGAEEEKDAVYSFVAEWYDPLPQLTKRYLLKYFPGTNDAEMVDLKTKRLFLKRSACPGTMSLKDFYVGGKIMLYGRELRIAQAADIGTEEYLQSRMASGVVVVEPNEVSSSGKMLDALLSVDLTLSQLKMFDLDSAHTSQVARLLGIEEDGLSGGPILVAVVKGSGVLSKLREALVGWKAWASEDATQAADVEEWFFGQKGPGRRLPSTATLDNCTCCVIRPHAVKQGVAGKILDEIWAQGYDVSAIEMFHLDRTTANEFYEVYQGAVQCYKEMVDEATSSPCIALELRAENAVDTFRQTAGPWDVEMAKELRPNSLRAMFGTDRVRNAVHCTDLPEDGVSECSYFFNVLQVQ